MAKSFKQWFNLQEIALSTNGRHDNQASQTADATTQVAQRWLADKSSVEKQAQIASGNQNPSTLANKLVGAGAEAVDKAPQFLAQKTTGPAVAGFLQNQFKLPKVLPPTTSTSFMKKRMRKR